jgi:hypothetical protein
MSKKFKFNLNGMTFQLPQKHLRTHGWNGEELDSPEIYMSHVATASVIKQYVKKNFPSVTVSSTSDSFSGGNSVSIYISDSYGNEVSEQIYEDVHSFAKMFQMGSFNGMIDLYEMNGDRDMVTENGTKIDVSTKWISVNNRPSFGSLPDVVRMLREMTTTDNYVFGQLSLEKAIEQVLDYKIPQTKIDKAIQLL